MSVRFDGEYPASTSNDFTIIPSHDEWIAPSRKDFILFTVASQVNEASSASIYKRTTLKTLEKHKDESHLNDN